MFTFRGTYIACSNYISPVVLLMQFFCLNGFSSDFSFPFGWQASSMQSTETILETYIHSVKDGS